MTKKSQHYSSTQDLLLMSESEVISWTLSHGGDEEKRSVPGWLHNALTVLPNALLAGIAASSIPSLVMSATATVVKAVNGLGIR